MGENFIEDLIEYLAEINELDTGTLLLDGVPFELRGHKILESEELKNNYGNRVVSNFDALYKAIDKASNEFDESVIDIVAKDYNCSKSQAITKLALAWNIRAKQGKGKWFEKQSRFATPESTIATTTCSVLSVSRSRTAAPASPFSPAKRPGTASPTARTWSPCSRPLPI